MFFNVWQFNDGFKICGLFHKLPHLQAELIKSSKNVWCRDPLKGILFTFPFVIIVLENPASSCRLHLFAGKYSAIRTSYFGFVLTMPETFQQKIASPGTLTQFPSKMKLFFTIFPFSNSTKQSCIHGNDCWQIRKRKSKGISSNDCRWN